jgi:uncharacterized protein YabE (DUF348 family)
MVALILGLVAFIGTNKSVSLTVDGQSTDVMTFGGTVAEVLQKADVQVTAADRVSPALGEEVTDGTAIEVFKAKTVDLTLDGEGHTAKPWPISCRSSGSHPTPPSRLRWTPR